MIAAGGTGCGGRTRKAIIACISKLEDGSLLASLAGVEVYVCVRYIRRHRLEHKWTVASSLITRMVKIFMRRGCSTGVSRQGVLDSGCHVADRAQAEQGRGRAAR
jgi:hypothetical protein